MPLQNSWPNPRIYPNHHPSRKLAASALATSPVLIFVDYLLALLDLLRMLLYRDRQESPRISGRYGECVERSDTFLALEG